ncbi:DUF6497 family protein [Roseovarius salis]|uniref:DUF6497 family protein n=1 Tax=Roseovarius salis TaxID=3376063 RepID=UPI0037CB8821
MRGREPQGTERAAALAGAAVMAALAAAPGQGKAKEERLALPSGLTARLQEVIRQEGPVMRFRYVAPGFDRAAGLSAIQADLEHLCAAHAAPRARAAGADGARIVVSLADRASEFGVFDPEVAQVFEAYRLENGVCIWEAF